jgi:O-antigen ligase
LRLTEGSFPSLPRASTFGLLGVCAYLVGSAVPLTWDLPLAALVLSSIPVVIGDTRDGWIPRSPLDLPVLGFVAVSGLSILLSEDVVHSAKLSAALLPAVLLYWVIAHSRWDPQQIRLFYLTFAVTGLGLASALWWTAWSHAWELGDSWQSWVPAVGSPLLLVPNDGTFLAVIFSFALVLLYREPRSALGGLAVLSILMSIGALCLLRTRVGILTMLLSLSCVLMLLRSRLGLTCGFGVGLLVLLIDGLLGFPLIAKFGRFWDGRLSLWAAAWGMFLEAPLFGHGPHTFGRFYQTYLEGLRLPPWLPIDPSPVPWAHNLYIEVLAEQGILGLAALGFLLASGWAAARHIRRGPIHEVRLWGTGAFAGFVSFCMAACIELTFKRQWVVITLFALLGAIAQLSSTQAEVKEGTSWR